MKRIIIVLLAALMLLACQPTPDHDAVKQKDTNVLIDTVLSEQKQQEQADAPQLPVKAQYPARFQCDFCTDVRSVHVTADVPIRIRTEDTVPLLRVEPWTGSPKENLAIVQALLGTDRVYKSVYQVTRADLEKQIVDLMTTLIDPYAGY